MSPHGWRVARPLVAVAAASLLPIAVDARAASSPCLTPLSSLRCPPARGQDVTPELLTTVGAWEVHLDRSRSRCASVTGQVHNCSTASPQVRRSTGLRRCDGYVTVRMPSCRSFAPAEAAMDALEAASLAFPHVRDLDAAHPTGARRPHARVLDDLSLIATGPVGPSPANHPRRPSGRRELSYPHP